ncbi:class I SAM-dependent methyltransferase [Candidatus Binatus soli]|uniref:class I SAM-dependent methyltransferase n=1 Tax=Candidatus Binatus soli TaxID=1953413 RepID=UPI003D09FC38
MTQKDSRANIAAMATNTDTDSGRLLREQYKDGSNLSARIRLHQRFSTNRYGLMRWMFDCFRIPENASVLELGCGTGILWRSSVQVPAGWRVVLTDMSGGMIRETRANLARLGHPFTFAQADAQALAFRDASFDAVIANHMLYHVPDIPRALGEVRRVLKPSGFCYAATMGVANMREIDELAARFFSVPRMTEATARFGLESGEAYMRRAFGEVKLERYPDSLVVTEAAPLMDYICSMRVRSRVTNEQIADLRRHLENEIAARGEIRISKDTGMFIARR